MQLRRSIRRRGAFYVSTIIGLAAIVACKDSTEPDPAFSGVYDLALVDGQSLPAIYLRYGLFGETKRVVEGSLRFTSRSRLVDARHWRDYKRDGSQDNAGDTSTFSFHVDDELLIIRRSNPDAPASSYSDTGVVVDNVLYMKVRTVDGTPNQVRNFTYTKRQ